LLTLFSIPKAFRGQAGTRQWNAIQSWLRLDSDIEIVLFGDDEGVCEFAKEWGVRHEGGLRTSASGAPFIDEVFRRIEATARYGVVCYVNADIILMSDFTRAVKRVSHFSRFFLTGRRYDLVITDRLSEEDPNWEQTLQVQATKPHPAKGIDYWVYRKGLFEAVPPFIVGRNYWDNWWIYRARQLGIPVIDGTECIRAVHQSHDIEGPIHRSEVMWNRKLAGVSGYFNVDDSTHVLTTDGIRAKSVSLRFVDGELLVRASRLYPPLSLVALRRNPRHYLLGFRRLIGKVAEGLRSELCL
jgi:hypothetical protein